MVTKNYSAGFLHVFYLFSFHPQAHVFSLVKTFRKAVCGWSWRFAAAVFFSRRTRAADARTAQRAFSARNQRLLCDQNDHPAKAECQCLWAAAGAARSLMTGCVSLATLAAHHNVRRAENGSRTGIGYQRTCAALPALPTKSRSPSRRTTGSPRRTNWTSVTSVNRTLGTTRWTPIPSRGTRENRRRRSST